MEWREDEDEARTSLYEQDEYQMCSGNPLDDPNYVPNTGAVRAAYATDYYMVQVRGGHDELERAERFDRWLAAEKAKWQAEAWERGAAAPRMQDGSELPAVDNPYKKGSWRPADDTSREQP